MKKQTATLFLLFVLIFSSLTAQTKLDSIQFFIDEKPIAVNILKKKRPGRKPHLLSECLTVRL
jgi:hypothetical protein